MTERLTVLNTFNFINRNYIYFVTYYETYFFSLFMSDLQKLSLYFTEIVSFCSVLIWCELNTAVVSLCVTVF
jgi:hypothetical protein